MFFLLLKKSLNNLFCIVINIKGEIICYTSCGIAGFKGPAKDTPYAAEQAGILLGKKLRLKKIFILDIFFLKIKVDRKIRDCLKGLYSQKIKIKKIILLPKVAHNGLRLKKKKRK